ncbi:hypothetical protein T06_6313 [Trichinella sp. T6]|nr:hypothetical protein T06_6313 [Trichinella sp. T6]
MGKEMTTCKYVEELAAHFRNAFAAARKHSVEEQKRQRQKEHEICDTVDRAVRDYRTSLRGELSHPELRQPQTNPAAYAKNATETRNKNDVTANSTPSRGHIAHDWCGLKKTVDWKGRQHQQWYLRGRGGSETHQRDTTITSFIGVARRDCQRSWRCNAIMISITCTSITHRRRDNAFLHKVALSRRVLTSSVACLFTPLRVRYCFVSLFSTE